MGYTTISRLAHPSSPASGVQFSFCSFCTTQQPGLFSPRTPALLFPHFPSFKSQLKHAFLGRISLAPPLKDLFPIPITTFFFPHSTTVICHVLIAIFVNVFIMWCPHRTLSSVESSLLCLWCWTHSGHFRSHEASVSSEQHGVSGKLGRSPRCPPLVERSGKLCQQLIKQEARPDNTVQHRSPCRLLISGIINKVWHILLGK